MFFITSSEEKILFMFEKKSLYFESVASLHF